MDVTNQLNQLITDLSTYNQKIGSVVKLFKEIPRLEQNRIENLPVLRAHLNKLKASIELFSQSAVYGQLMGDWINQYQQALDGAQEQRQKHFGVELEGALKEKGLSLSGQYPKLRAGFFTIELDFDKMEATLWYGPEQERMDKCRLSVTEVTKHIEKVRQQLGSRLSEEEFLNKLHAAYSRRTGSKRGGSVPIIEILAELAYLLQDSRFRQDPRRENYKGYSRADFSYDLYRARRNEPRSLFVNRLHLTTATRAHTNRRQDFLWVPDDESGKGTTYSHLQFKEGA